MSAAAAHCSTGMRSSASLTSAYPGGVLCEECLIDGIASHQQTEDRTQQERIGARPHGEMQIRHLGGLCAARIDDDQLAVRIFPDLVELVAGIGKAMGDPWIGADHEQQVAMMHVLGGVAGLAAEHVTVDPEIAGFLLRERVEDMARAERTQQRVRIGAAGMIALAAAAIKRKAFSAVTLDHLAQARRDLRDRGVPVDFVESAVGAAAQRRGQPVLVMRIERNARGLVAEIALRLRVLAVAAHLGNFALVDQNLEAAIHVAEIAGCLTPFRNRHRKPPIRIALPETLHDDHHENNRFTNVSADNHAIVPNAFSVDRSAIAEARHQRAPRPRSRNRSAERYAPNGRVKFNQSTVTARRLTLAECPVGESDRH